MTRRAQATLTASRHAAPCVILKDVMLAPLLRVVRLIHMTIGITEPEPSEERIIALAWLALFVALIAIFVVGLFFLG